MKKGSAAGTVVVWLIAGVVIAAGAQMLWSSYGKNIIRDNQKIVHKISSMGRELAKAGIKKVDAAKIIPQAKTPEVKPAEKKIAAKAPQPAPAPIPQQTAKAETTPQQNIQKIEKVEPAPISKPQQTAADTVAAAQEKKKDDELITRLGRVADMLEGKSSHSDDIIQEEDSGKISTKTTVASKDNNIERQISIINDLLN